MGTGRAAPDAFTLARPDAPPRAVVQYRIVASASAFVSFNGPESTFIDDAFFAVDRGRGVAASAFAMDTAAAHVTAANANEIRLNTMAPYVRPDSRRDDIE
ncbi:hypothetical protein GCM10010151_20580 [Actinoallomurus spadix]|uniref:Uncharacterized protein n=1 Tax=Actinoallomurus spadix TaxID=79912 RepID=A0ABN0WAA3_9ACTN